MGNSISSISEIQETIKTELEKNSFFSERNVPIICENSKTIEYEIKTAMASLGIAATVATPNLSFKGMTTISEVKTYAVVMPTDIEVSNDVIVDNCIYTCSDISSWGEDNIPNEIKMVIPSLDGVTVTLENVGASHSGTNYEYNYLVPTTLRPLEVIAINFDSSTGIVAAFSYYYDYTGKYHPVNLSESTIPFEETTFKVPFWEMTAANIVVVENPTLNRGKENYATALDTALQIALTLQEIDNACNTSIQQTSQGGLLVVNVQFKTNIGFSLEKVETIQQ